MRPPNYNNASNPSGTQAVGVWTWSPPLIEVSLTVDGFNSTNYSKYFYERTLLLKGSANFTESGTLGSGAHYTLFGNCYKNGYCSSIWAVGVVTVYVVIDFLTSFPQMGNPDVNSTAAINLLQAQLIIIARAP